MNEIVHTGKKDLRARVQCGLGLISLGVFTSVVRMFLFVGPPKKAVSLGRFL